MDNQSWKVKEPNCNSRVVDVVEVFREGHLVHEELELEEILSWFSNGLLTRWLRLDVG